MIPSGDLSSTVYQSEFLSPDNMTRRSPLEDFELGGVGLNDPSAGLMAQVWYAWYSNGVIFIKPLES